MSWGRGPEGGSVWRAACTRLPLRPQALQQEHTGLTARLEGAEADTKRQAKELAELRKQLSVCGISIATPTTVPRMVFLYCGRAACRRPLEHHIS